MRKSRFAPAFAPLVAALFAVVVTGSIIAQADARLEKIKPAHQTAVSQVQAAQRSIALGNDALGRQKYSEAISAFLEAIAANPTSVETYYQLAQAFAGAKKYSETRHALGMYAAFLDEAGRERSNNRFARESLPGQPFYGFLTNYQNALVTNREWGAAPDDAYGIAIGTKDTYYAKVRARASDAAIEQKNNAMMQATCRAAGKSVGNTAALHAIARQTLESAKRTSGRVQIGGVVCTLSGESVSCAGTVRPGMLECTGVAEGGSFAECECGSYLRVPGGAGSIKYLGD